MRASADLDRTDAVGGGACAVRGRSRGAVGAVALSLALLMSACSGDGDSSADDTVETDESPSEGPGETAGAAADDEDDEDDAATLTAPGSQLAYGDTATVEYSARGDTATLDLTVRSAERGSLDDFAGFDTQDSLVRNANFYYVRVRVENVGEQRFGNAEVPLWGISGQDTLLPPVNFTTDFDTCPTEPLPRRFRPGDSFSTCLVFLSPKRGSLEGVSYRPTVEFTPIEWRGRVERAGGGGGSGNGRDRGND